MLPDYNDPITLAFTFNMFIIHRIASIWKSFPLHESSLSPYSFESTDSILPTILLASFTMITRDEYVSVLMKTMFSLHSSVARRTSTLERLGSRCEKVVSEKNEYNNSGYNLTDLNRWP